MTRQQGSRDMAMLGTVLCLALAGCGSDESGLDSPTSMTCGEGTTPVGGECVPIDAGTGGQGGGGAGEGGTGGAGGGAGGGDDAGPDAPEAGGGGPGPDDDPCPPQPVELDCSDQCGGPTAACAGATCERVNYEGHSVEVIKDVAEYPYVFRTPARPGVDPECAEACAEGAKDPDWVIPPAYGVAVTIEAPYDESKVLRVRVGPPWWIQIALEGQPYFCLDTPLAQGCSLAWKSSYLMVTIMTDDPNAPARNVVLDLVDKPGSCQ